MTQIKKMVMHGFKSFAKRTEIVFDDHFNCILGPNGSGKSNVLDALCFVLGKSSAKGLRAEKSANLIYNGGKSKKPAKAGIVSISFDNSDNTFPITSDEVMITRIITQSGQSKYRINEMNATRQEIVDLLSVAKIDPDAYNIILQGDIVHFIEMTPMEKRKVIEEISGISIYEDKKDKAMNELNKVDSKLSEADIIMKERKTYLRELKSDRDQALKYKELNNKILENKASYLKIRIGKKESILKIHESKIEIVKKSHDKKISEIDSSKHIIKEKRNEVDNITKKVEGEGESENLKLQKIIERLRVDLVTSKTRVSSCQNEMMRVDQKRVQLQKNLSEIDQKIEELYSKRKKLEDKKNNLSKEKETIALKISDFKKKHKIEEDSAEIDKAVETSDKKAEELQKDIQELREQQQNILREKDRIEFQIQTIDEQIQKVNEVEKQHKKEIYELKNKKAQFTKITLELNKKLDESSSLSSDISSLESSLFRDKEQLAKLRIRDAGKREKTFANIAVKKILENKNKFGKIYGTVSQLGNVPSKYSLAMEVAAGARLNSIVVEDDSVASKCIKYLRNNRLGVVTFFPLNKIKGHKIDESSKSFKKSAGALGYAVELISFDSQFRNIFSYVFKDTLLVDNIDNARKIGVGSVRMVTLSGDIIEKSGAMQGGYRRIKETAFQEKELRSDIDSIESRIGEYESKIMILEKKRKENESRIISLREQKASLEGEIIKVEKSLHLKSDDLDASISYKKSLSSKLSAVDKESDEMAYKISSINKEFAMIKIQRQGLKTKLSQIRNPLLLAELNTFDQRKNDVTQEIFGIDSNIKSIDVQVNDIFKRDKLNTAKIINDLDKEEKGFRDEIKLLGSRVKEQNVELKEKEKKQAEFYSKFKSLFAKRSKINEEITKIEDNMNRIDLDARKEEFTINTISLEIAKVKAELSGLNEEFTQYAGIKINLKKTEEELKKEINAFEHMKENIGSVNMRALEIYEKVESEYNSLMDKKKSLVKEKEEVLKLMQQIETKKKDLFTKTFDAVNKNFQNIFSSLSTKGKAYLDLENTDNPFDGGLFIKVKLTGKRYLDIRSLSGGEKTLTALAFIFSVQEYEPASFYVLDEVDAALDKHNSEKFARLIAKYAENSQYITISHNDMIISHANSLYGVSMDTHGITKMVSLKI